MTAKNIISPTASLLPSGTARTVRADEPVVNLLPKLLDSPGHLLNVEEDGRLIGVINEASMLEGLATQFAARDDSSIVVVECSPSDYSASLLAHAVEDVDTHLVDLWTTPTSEGRIRVTMRVRHTDPSPIVHSLERYDYNVVEAYATDGLDPTVSDERLTALQLYLNV